MTQTHCPFTSLSHYKARFLLLSPQLIMPRKYSCNYSIVGQMQPTTHNPNPSKNSKRQPLARQDETLVLGGHTIFQFGIQTVVSSEERPKKCPSILPTPTTASFLSFPLFFLNNLWRCRVLQPFAPSPHRH